MTVFGHATPQQENQTQETPKLVAAAANPGALQTATPAVAKSVPRKVVQRPEPFVLDKQSLKTLQSTAPEHAKAKEALLEHAARTFDLKLQDVTLRGDTTELMAPFVNVRSLELEVYADDLPVLPCPQKLESLFVGISVFKTVNNIKYYPNLHTLVLGRFEIELSRGRLAHIILARESYFAMMAPFKNLRRFYCEQPLLSGISRNQKHIESLERFIENNPQINDLGLVGWVSPYFVSTLRALPLRTFSLRADQLGDRLGLVLRGNKTLEEVKLRYIGCKTNLACLQDAPYRMLSLRGHQLSVKSARVLCSMTALKELTLSFYCLKDEVASEPLTMASQLHKLTLECHNGLSIGMRIKLQDTFGDRVRLLRRDLL